MIKFTFNNFKIRNKLLIIYFSCVFIPIIVTDVVILLTVNQSYEDRKKNELSYVMERVEYNLTETVDGCILFTNNLYNDRFLDDFLNREYEDNISYYSAYIHLLRNNNLSYNYNNGVVLKIEVFADNDSIINGGKISKVDVVRDTKWYKDFTESGEDIFLYIYYDADKKLLAGSGISRTISIIRRLDNFGNNEIEKFLKIDIDYNLMLRDVLNEKVDANIYVRNEDFILFSNLPNQNSMKEYLPASMYDSSDATMTSTFTIGKQRWEILIMSESTPFWTVIFENKGLIPLVIWNIIIPSLLIYFVGKSITKRLSIVATHMDKVKEEHFEVIDNSDDKDEIGGLIRSYNLMVLKIRNLIEVVFKGKEEKQTLYLSKKQAELKAVQSQVNPHFLFNTLETIRMRSLLKDETETADIIEELALLFRNSMDWRSDYITIEEEMRFVEKYINIQRYRFGDKIKYYHYIMDGCSDYKVPKLAIGTFIENAFIHGIETSEKDGIISLNITKNKETLFINISDNGKGFTSDKLNEIKYMLKHADSQMLLETKNTGMLNAFLRLKMFCEGNIIFKIDSVLDNGTDIMIQIPLVYVVKN